MHRLLYSKSFAGTVIDAQVRDKKQEERREEEAEGHRVQLNYDPEKSEQEGL